MRRVVVLVMLSGAAVLSSCSPVTAYFGIHNHKKQFSPDFQELLGQLVAGRITPTIKAAFPLAELQAAHRAWEKGDGSIVIAVGRG